MGKVNNITNDGNLATIAPKVDGGASSFLTNVIQRQVLPYFGSKVQVYINEPAPALAYDLPDTQYKTQPVWPLSFVLKNGKRFDFKIEPIISISGSNVVAKRNVAKGKQRGTIKERFSTDDWEINISGILVDENGYPSDQIKALKEVLEAPEAVKVESKPLLDLDIHYVVIESYDFPHTTGENRQAFDIKCCSDYEVPLFIKI